MIGFLEDPVFQIKFTVFLAIFANNDLQLVFQICWSIKTLGHLNQPSFATQMCSPDTMSYPYILLLTTEYVYQRPKKASTVFFF
jgi:hypothetical protein